MFNVIIEGAVVKRKERDINVCYIFMNGTLLEKRPRESCSTCYFNCSKKIGDDTRSTLCSSFWELKDIKKQREYLVSRIKRSEPRISKVASSRRKFSNTYTFICQGQTHKVCKKFFLATLDISEKMIRTAFKKSDASKVRYSQRSISAPSGSSI